MKGSRDRRDPESSLSAVVCPLQCANLQSAVVRSLPGLLVQTRTHPHAFLPAMRHARPGYRRPVRELPSWRPRLRPGAVSVSLHRSDAWHPASLQVLRPSLTGTPTRPPASRSHASGRFSGNGCSASPAPPLAGTRAWFQPGGAARPPARTRSGSRPPPASEEHPEPDGPEPLTAGLESLRGIRGATGTTGLRPRRGRRLHDRRNSARDRENPEASRNDEG